MNWSGFGFVSKRFVSPINMQKHLEDQATTDPWEFNSISLFN